MSNPFPRFAPTLTAIALVAAPVLVRAEPPAVKLFLAEAGVYRVSHEELVAGGWPAAPVASAALRLTQRGAPVALQVEDGADGLFGAGDALLFVGEHLPGEHSYHNEFTSRNVYRLSVGEAGDGSFMLADRPRAAPAGADSAANWNLRRRFEEDAILLRYRGKGQGEEELWYWRKLSQIDREPFALEVDLADLDPASSAPIRVEIELRGWSTPRNKASIETPDHAVDLLWNGEPLRRIEWDGVAAPVRAEVEIARTGAADARSHRLELRVPVRPLATGGEAIVDVSVLNWVSVTAPRGDRAPGAAERLEVAAGASPPRLRAAPDRALELFALAAGSVRRFVQPAGGGALTFPDLAAGTALWAVPAGEHRRLLGVEPDLPSNLRSAANRADYLMVAHSTLLEAVRPLAEFHRRRGLEVALVDIRDVYDEWNDGIVSPRALRDFVAHAWKEWARPAPRFLLLVGDSSWDGKNELVTDRDSPDWTQQTDRIGRFIKNGSQTYEGFDGRNTRNLVPTWDFGTHEGHAASDNVFADVEGDDHLPELAVGRFPVVTPEEVAAIVAKTMRYAEEAPPGDWRRNVLWITNEAGYIQRWTDQLSERFDGLGLASTKIYPVSDLEAGKEDPARLRAAFDAGAAIVHFMGHGGRYIWRTGPPDLATQRDLFTLGDVERLAPNGRLPIVLSMTCYSAPFDHPSADSIGEKLLREPERGAVAVLAASWRNSPNQRQSQTILDELLAGRTIGEAIARAKRALADVEFAEQYNLLGDPALVLATPVIAAPAAEEPARRAR